MSTAHRHSLHRLYSASKALQYIIKSQDQMFVLSVCMTLFLLKVFEKLPKKMAMPSSPVLSAISVEKAMIVLLIILIVTVLQNCCELSQ